MLALWMRVILCTVKTWIGGMRFPPAGLENHICHPMPHVVHHKGTLLAKTPGADFCGMAQTQRAMMRLLLVNLFPPSISRCFGVDRSGGSNG